MLGSTMRAPVSHAGWFRGCWRRSWRPTRSPVAALTRWWSRTTAVSNLGAASVSSYASTTPVGLGHQDLQDSSPHSSSRPPLSRPDRPRPPARDPARGRLRPSMVAHRQLDCGAEGATAEAGGGSGRLGHGSAILKLAVVPKLVLLVGAGTCKEQSLYK
jgi:hypothetical protein